MNNNRNILQGDNPQITFHPDDYKLYHHPYNAQDERNHYNSIVDHCLPYKNKIIQCA
ncbi:MAG: hypothetical protein H5T39_02640 [Methanobacteriales archaeon]|nr:hypothetical protein [Methanobacteriales archaeon]